MTARIVGLLGWVVILLTCVVQATLHASGYYGADAREASGAFVFFAGMAVMLGAMCFAPD